MSNIGTLRFDLRYQIRETRTGYTENLFLGQNHRQAQSAN